MQKVLLALILGGALCGGAHAQERFVYEGVFDVPMLEGSFVPDDCVTGTPLDTPEARANIGEDFPEFVCFAQPYSKDADGGSLEWDYVRALDAEGWKFAGGAGNAYFMEKPVDETCSRKLYMMGVIQGDPVEVAKWGRAGEKDMDWSKIENTLFLFTEAEEQVCGDKRRAE